MTLFFHLHRVRATCIILATVFLVGCQNTTTELRGNGLVLGNKANEPKSKAPIATDPVLVRAPKAHPVQVPKTISPKRAAASKKVVLTPPENINTQVRVGLLLPLSGPRSSVGQTLNWTKPLNITGPPTLPHMMVHCTTDRLEGKRRSQALAREPQLDPGQVLSKLFSTCSMRKTTSQMR